jgi:hypothetical protein
MLENWMQELSRIAAAAALFVCVPAGVVLAQSTPNTETGTTAAPAQATTTAPAPATEPAATPPAATTAPAPATAPAATPPTAATTPAPATEPAATPPAATTAEPAIPTKKKKAVKISRQQEIERSIATGTVPARFRRSVPKEYQHYIPFAK